MSNLAEFGMGMKSAACWFAHTWSVRSKALGETKERTVTFDVDAIVDEGIDELSVGTMPAPANEHYTEVILTNLHKSLGPRTIGTKHHLASIYRIFTRDGVLGSSSTTTRS